MDWFDAAELLMAIEEEFDIELPDNDEEVEKIKTVQNLVDLILSRLKTE